MKISRVLCVCKGNSDRSPAMRAILKMYLNNTEHNNEVEVESAGILEIADKGGNCSPFVSRAAKRIGLNLSDHGKRWIERLDFSRYDLFVCVDEQVAARVIELGAKMEQVCNVQVSNPWPSQFQEDHDQVFQNILGAMYKVITRYFSN